MMGTYALYRIAQWANTRLPPGFCVWLAERLADLHCRRSVLDRSAVQSNLTLILGEAVVEGSPLVREVFRNFARYLVEFLGAHRRQPTVMFEGYERLANAVRLHRGSIVLSAHIGNWELGAVALRQLGFPVSVVVLPHQDSRVNQFFDHQRLRCGVGVISLGAKATQRCLQRLREGQMLGILGDREFGPNGIFVSLFGRQAFIPYGPAILSLRTGAPVIPAFFMRERPGQFRFYIEPPIWPPQGPKAKSTVVQLTQTYVRVIERYLRQFPSQWLMFQPFASQPTTAKVNANVWRYERVC